MLVLSPGLSRFGAAGLLGAFLAGQAALLVCGLRAITSELGFDRPIEWACLQRRELRVDLLLVGLFYNLGIWADKLVFC